MAGIRACGKRRTGQRPDWRQKIGRFQQEISNEKFAVLSRKRRPREDFPEVRHRRRTQTLAVVDPAREPTRKITADLQAPKKRACQSPFLHLTHLFVNAFQQSNGVITCAGMPGLENQGSCIGRRHTSVRLGSEVYRHCEPQPRIRPLPAGARAEAGPRPRIGGFLRVLETYRLMRQALDGSVKMQKWTCICRVGATRRLLNFFSGRHTWPGSQY
jgi:hypothetical protein